MKLKPFQDTLRKAKAEIQDSLIANTYNPDSIFFISLVKASPKRNFLNENAVLCPHGVLFCMRDIYEEPTN